MPLKIYYLIGHGPELPNGDFMYSRYSYSTLPFSSVKRFPGSCFLEYLPRNTRSNCSNNLPEPLVTIDCKLVNVHRVGTFIVIMECFVTGDLVGTMRVHKPPELVHVAYMAAAMGLPEIEAAARAQLALTPRASGQAFAAAVEEDSTTFSMKRFAGLRLRDGMYRIDWIVDQRFNARQAMTFLIPRWAFPLVFP